MIEQLSPVASSNGGYDLVGDDDKASARHVAWSLIVVSLVANFLFGGFIYGWASILLFLQGEHEFSEVCAASDVRNSVTGTCTAQDHKLAVIFGVAQVLFTVSSLPIGLALDRFGPVATATFAGLTSTVGLVLLAVSSSTGVNAFVPAYALVALGGTATLLTGFKTGFVVLAWQTAVLASVNCFFDASAVMPNLLFAIHEASGASRRTLLLVYAGFAAVTYSLLVGLWHIHTARSAPPCVDGEGPELETTQTPATDTALVHATLWTQLLSFEFRHLLLFTIIHSFHNAFYFGTVNYTLANYEDTSHVYTKVFGWVLPVGFVYIPLINLVIERGGLAVSMFVTTVLCISCLGLSFVPSLPLQVVAFVLFTGFRAFFYANNTAFAAQTFGPAHMGSIIGITYAISGLIALLEVPAANATNNSKAGWYTTYGVATGLALALLPFTEAYRRRKLLDHPRPKGPSSGVVAWALVATVLLSNLLFAGFIYGWASMLLLLQQENQYSERCTSATIDESTGRCSQQDSKLSLIYGVAQFTLTFSSLPSGVALDKVGPMWMSAVCGTLATTGFVLMALSESATFDAFVYGYGLIAIAGSATLLTSLRAGFVITRWQTAIFAGINCLFDASAVMPSLLHTIHGATDISRRSLLLVYAVLTALVYGLLVVLWYLQQRHAATAIEEANDPESPKYEALDETVPLTDAPLKTQFKSFEFRYLLLFAAVHNLQSSFYFGTVNQTLVNYHDTTEVYTKAFGWILPAGFVFIPVIDTLVDRFGLPVSMLSTTLLSLTYHILAMIPSLPLQIVTFVLFTAFRALFYANVATCGAVTFGHANMGKILGTVYSSSAIVALLEIPAAQSANTSSSGWHVMYAISLGLAVVMLPIIALYRRRFYKTAESGSQSIEVEKPIVPPRSEVLAWALVILVWASNLLFAGFIFGWASMLLMLQQENQYGERCTPETINESTGRCSEQDSKLSLIYGVAQFLLSFCSFFTGIALDKFGPLIMTCVAGVFAVVGYVLMAVSDSATFDAFVFGYGLLGMSGCVTLLASYRSGFVILRWQTAIIAGICCLFDGSAVMPSVLYAIHKSGGFSRQAILLVYAGLAFVVYGSLVVLWYIQERQGKVAEGTIDSVSDNSDPEAALSQSYSSLQEEKPLTEAPLWTQFKSFEFRFLLTFTAIHNLQSSFYFGTVNQALANYGDDNKVYTKAFGWIMPAGFVFIPLIDFVVGRYGIAASMALNTIFCMCFHALSLIPSLQLQVVSFVFFTAFRALFYSNVATCGATTFGSMNMGKIIGAVNTAAALVALLEIPLVEQAHMSTARWRTIYIVSLCLAALLLPLVALYRRRVKSTE
ncbi:hypothetical protein ACHHYP_10280 [Achlya hypogyna]|uniref:Major Facilitator Superfamily (MFS) n=1 Tax=Achlya hypogyna TaxID=1202772 RepID=A0A1V9YLV8_ACHHY|nr:hypothetical protein ACHHYP_10280 [Achlya hypogyna]